MRSIKLIVFILVTIFLFNCAGSVDTSNLSMEEHFKYAKQLYDEEDYLSALSQFQSLLLQYPGSAINDDAQYYLGMTHFKRGEYILAAYEFSKLIRDIPGSDFVADAQFMLAESYYQLSPPSPLDQKYTEKAIEEFQAFIDFFPTNKKVEEADRKIAELYLKLAEKEFNNAIIYEKMEYYYAAIKYFQIVIEKYHDTKFASDAFYHKINLEIEKKMFDDAKDDLKTYSSRYPEDKRIEELKSLLKESSNG